MIFNCLWERLNEQCTACNAVRSQRSAALQGDLEERLAEIVRSVNERKDHIPPVVSSATVTFPFEISIAGCTICVHCRVVMSARTSAVI